MRSGFLLSICVAVLGAAACERARNLEVDTSASRREAKPTSERIAPTAPAADDTTTALEPSRAVATVECALERAGERTDDEPHNAVSCGDKLTMPRDLYRALTLGTEDEKAGAAFVVLHNRHAHARTVISRAITAATQAPSCSHLRPLNDLLRDCSMDVSTRAGAALALGTIAQRHPCLFPKGHCATPHDPLPQWAQKTLAHCTTKYPIAVARACTEALGYLTLAEVPLLTELRDNPGSDPVLRVFAGRALTRLTKTPQVTETSLDGVMSAAKRITR